MFATSDAVRVFEDGVGNPDQRLEGIRVFGLRNEIVSAQCVVQAHEALQDVAVSVDSLKQADSPATIPAENVRWNFVESIFIEKNTPKVNQRDLIRAAPARFPDCLGEARQCSLPKDARKAVYWTIAIPREAADFVHRHAPELRRVDACTLAPGNGEGQRWLAVSCRTIEQAPVSRQLA